MRIVNAKVFTQNKLWDGLAVTVENGRILSVLPKQEDQPGDMDAGGCILAPGFVDIHIHGMVGGEVTDSSEQIKKIAAFMAQRGTTSYLPSATGNEAELMTFFRYVREAMGCPGADIPGVNLEGPFINPRQKGAIPETSILSPDVETLDRLLDSGLVRLITMAPDLEGIRPLITRAAQRGTTVSLGHTRADSQTVAKAVAAGARHVTHLFNGMPPMHHREPGMVCAGLTTDSLTCELICDLIHLDGEAIKLAWKIKGPQRLCLITDAMSATGMPDGHYNLLGRSVEVRDGAARLEDGTLAGSTLTQDAALRNVVKKLGIPLEDALTMLAATPARQAGLTDRGIIAPGMRADMVLLDADLQVKQTFVAGQPCL